MKSASVYRTVFVSIPLPFILTFCGLVFCAVTQFVGAKTLPPGSAQQADASRVVVWRSEYRLALKDLTARRWDAFEGRKRTLEDYVLAPYLSYHWHRKKIDSLSNAQIAEFVRTNAGYPFAERLRDRWLLRLPALGRWSDYLANYRPSKSATRRCYYLRALYRSGKRQSALDLVEPLWLYGKSQPKACDSLFDAWKGAGYLTDKLVWQRMVLALNRNEVQLAKYLLKQMRSASFRKNANALYKAYTQPETHFNILAHQQDNPANRQILATGLKRLSRRDALQAVDLWRQVKKTHHFDLETTESIEAKLIIEAAEEKIFPTPDERPDDLSDSTLERVAREAVRQQNWREATHWIAQMTQDRRSKAEWRYWQHRSAGTDLSELATERNYYGFLAASDVDVESRLNHVPTAIPTATLETVSSVKGFERSLELYAVDDLINARREWQQAFSLLTQDQKAAAALMAQQHGWMDQSIIAANAAGLHNDLNLRFPQEFATIYDRAGHATNLPTSTLLAVTRQESAFAHRARSRANARGLMQLLPATAKRTAKKAGLRPPTTLDLYEPAINIRIASEYLAHLMKRYNQQRPLAFAAYNAGEHRVDRWVKDRAGTPMEVWIESIPFRETRGYVKSVLAFNHLYSKLQNQPIPLLMPHERTLKAGSSSTKMPDG